MTDAFVPLHVRIVINRMLDCLGCLTYATRTFLVQGVKAGHQSTNPTVPLYAIKGMG